MEFSRLALSKNFYCEFFYFFFMRRIFVFFVKKIYQAWYFFYLFSYSLVEIYIKISLKIVLKGWFFFHNWMWRKWTQNEMLSLRLFDFFALILFFIENFSSWQCIDNFWMTKYRHFYRYQWTCFYVFVVKWRTFIINWDNWLVV